MKFPTAVIAVILAGTSLSGKSSRIATPSQGPIAELDFEIVGGRIYVPAEVNGHKLSAVLDSGAGSSVLDTDLADRWNLPSGGKIAVQGGGNAMVGGKFLTKTVISVAGITEPIPIAIPLHPLDRMEGRHIESILGFHFFQTHVVEIDYQKRHLRIFNSSSNFMPTGVPQPIRIEGSLCHTTVGMTIDNDHYSLESIIDTGATGPALTTKFLDAHPLNVARTPLAEIGAGVGGSSRGQKFRPNSIQIGSILMQRPIVAMTESGGGVVGKISSFDLLLGAEVLQRFVITFDYAYSKVYLVPNLDAFRPFDADKTGLRVLAEGADLRIYRIKGVLPGSSAEKSGVKVDDVIESVDNLPASNYTLQELRELFRSPAAKEWKLGIRRDDAQLTISLEAKSII